MRKISNFDIFSSYAWYAPGVKGVVAMLALLIAGTLVGTLLQYLFLIFVPRDIWTAYGMLIVYPVQFLPAMMYALNKSRSNSLFEPGYKLQSCHRGPYRQWVLILVTVMLSLGTIIAADLPNYLNYKLTMLVPGMDVLYKFLLEAMTQLTGGPLWSSFLLTAIFAPLFEEWLCRGIVLRGLLLRMKPAWAIVISALFFAIIHANPWQALNAFIVGLVIGYVYYRTGSLLHAMLVHFVNNGIAVVMAHIPDIPQDMQLVDVLGTVNYTIVYIAGLALTGVGIWLFSRIPLEQERGNIDQIND